MTLPPLKKKALLACGTLNPRPEAVTSERFTQPFFDPHDSVQVKYEMLRAQRVEDLSVSEACRQFGFSRERFYQLREAFTQRGFSALVPAKRGRKGPTKLKGELLAFAQQQQRETPEIDPGRLATRIAERFGVVVHRTTVLRALKKKSAERPATPHSGRPALMIPFRPCMKRYVTKRWRSRPHPVRSCSGCVNRAWRVWWRVPVIPSPFCSRPRVCPARPGVARETDTTKLCIKFMSS